MVHVILSIVTSLNPLRLIREAPVTMLCLAVCGVLFLGTWRPNQSDSRHRQLLDRWGAVVDRSFTKTIDSKTRLVERDLRGPIALWRGQWWRIPVSAFHHVDVWHLVVNGLAAAYLGRILEKSWWGSGRFLLFIPFAAAIPMLAEFLVGNYVLGFSGVVAAMFGILCVLRYHDENLEEQLPEEAVHLGGAMLAFGMLFTLLDLAPVANLAHMTGFFYGALAGCVATGLPWGKSTARLVRLGVIVLSGVGLWFVMHPTWNGAYHWYVALEINDADVRYAELQRAVKLEPTATGAWRYLAGEELRRDQPMAAWNTLLVGLSFNPSDQQLMAEARRNWRKVVISPGRAEAARVIRDVFGDLASAWETQFRDERLDLEQPDFAFSAAVTEINPVIQYSLNQKVDLALPESADADHIEVAPEQRHREDDAVEGRRM